MQHIMDIKKKCSKNSFISEAYGIPINANINNGKKNDGKILVSHFNDMLIDKDLNNKIKNICQLYLLCKRSKKFIIQ